MIVKNILDEDFVNYKKPSMLIAFPSCSFKCERDCGRRVCQNSTLAVSPSHNVSVSYVADRYLQNPITQAVICGGLEPFDSWHDLYELVGYLRDHTEDDIVIYTGYTEEECASMGYINQLSVYPNIIVKFGRYVPDQDSHYDNVLGIQLASPNQYARQIS